MKILKSIFTILYGAICTFMIITCASYNVLDNIVIYIGPSLFGGVIYYCFIELRKKIEVLENEIKNLKKNK